MDIPPQAAWCRPLFEIRQDEDPDGALRLTLHGELDLAVGHALTARLRQLRRARSRVRLDLSQLEFIDCNGVAEIATALSEARRSRVGLEVDRRVSPSVERLAAYDEISSALWPADARPARAALG